VYAVDWNQARENVFAGAAWLGGAGAGGAEVIEQLRKPTALICSSRGGDKVALPGGRAKRDEVLLEMIKSCVAKGGVVLIPTDSSARVLELAYLLEHAWRIEAKDEDSDLAATKLYLASNNIGATMRYTKSMLEWMDDGIIREFEALEGGGQKSHPFDFKHLRLLERKGQIERMLDEKDNLGRSVGRKVIIASDTSLEWGFSKEVLRRIADDRRNLVILTERMDNPEKYDGRIGLAKTLWSWWEERRDGVATEPSSKGNVLEQVYAAGREVEIRDAKCVALEGNDLEVYQQWLATQQQLQTTLQNGGATALQASVDLENDSESDSSSDEEESDTEQQGKSLNISATMGQANRKKMGLSDEDLGINILLRKKGVHDYDVRGKKGREKMFPIVIRRKRVDDYGEIIRFEDFLRADERDEVDGEDMRPGNYDTKDTLGKKRKFDNVAAAKDRELSNGPNKRQLLTEFDPNLGPLQVDLVEDYDGSEDVEEVFIGPSRLEISTEKLAIDLRLAFVDFSGLHDKRSLQRLIPLIQPRKLILVGGLKEETLALANDCRKLLAGLIGRVDETAEDIFTPEVGVVVDASVDTNSWVIKLTDTLVKRLRWQDLKGLKIVTLTGQLEVKHPIEPEVGEEGSNKKQKMLKGEAEEIPAHEILDSTLSAVEVPTLDVLPSNMASATRSVAQPLHVGDLRLADLRKIMQSSGHTAEFRGEGILLIDGSVIVRKTGTGKIDIESIGLLAHGASQQDSTFYAVKSKIYEGLAVVAGG
jgi:cleavage and polyadenylation specificity factor subunit 2